MKVFDGTKIRNIVILGHSGSGKTTVAEAALFGSGATSRMGKTEDGNTVSDYDADEIRRRVSISLSLVPVEWKDTKINFLDAPGYFDFVGEAQQALRVADLALIVINAKSGVEVGAEKAWEYAKSHQLPAMVLINGCDDENADYDAAFDMLKEKFGPSIAPIHVPFREGGKFVGFVDIIKNEGVKYNGNKPETCPIPADVSGKVGDIRHILEEAVSGSDEELMEKFIMEEPLTSEEIVRGLKGGILDGSVTPVLCASAPAGTGIADLMDAIVAFAPPAIRADGEVTGKNPKTDEDVKFKTDAAAPFSALVFKTISDSFGRISIFRVYSGSVNRSTALYNANTESNEKIGGLLVLRGKEQISAEELKAGDIGAIVKLANTSTSDTLCTKDNPIILPRVNYSEPLYSQAVAPKNKGDEDKLGQAISRIQDEDKTVSFKIDPETKQSVLSGIGDNHLDVVVHKMKNRFKLEVELSPVIVPYRETIKAKVEQQGRHKKQSGGRGQFGDVHIRFEPSGDMSVPYEFHEEIVGGSVPRNFWPAVEKGLAECVKSGPIAGYPVVGLKATLFFGSYHDVDSDELSFRLATSIAFKEGFMKAKPVILEPIASVDVIVPDSYTGDIMGDMNKRRGRVLGMSMKGGKQVISAEAPMSEMLKYPLDLRSMTQGRGEFTMTFNRYEEAPNDVAQKVIDARKKE